jgi:hypothetical protein
MEMVIGVIVLLIVLWRILGLFTAGNNYGCKKAEDGKYRAWISVKLADRTWRTFDGDGVWETKEEAFEEAKAMLKSFEGGK